MKTSSLRSIEQLRRVVTMRLSAPISSEDWDRFCGSVGLSWTRAEDGVSFYSFAPGAPGTEVSKGVLQISIWAPAGIYRCLREAALLREAIAARWPVAGIEVCQMPPARRTDLPGLPDLLARVTGEGAVHDSQRPPYQGRWVETPGPAGIVAKAGLQ